MARHLVVKGTVVALVLVVVVVDIVVDDVVEGEVLLENSEIVVSRFGLTEKLLIFNVK